MLSASHSGRFNPVEVFARNQEWNTKKERGCALYNTQTVRAVCHYMFVSYVGTTQHDCRDTLLPWEAICVRWRDVNYNTRQGPDEEIQTQVFRSFHIDFLLSDSSDFKGPT